MSTPTSEFLDGLSFSIPARQQGRPLRDLRIEQQCASYLAIEAISQGKTGYAGDGDNPRPLRPRSLFQLKKTAADMQYAAPKRGGLPAQCFFYAFCNRRISMSLTEAIPVPREDLWWLAAPGDLLLLSDSSTHHYVSVHHVDTAGERIHLLDPWPERIFLRAGLNSADVEAVVEPLAPGASTLGVSITREELMRVVVGLITRDTSELIDHYLTALPAQRENFDVQLALGHALLGEERYALAPHAVSRFKAALALAPGSEAQLMTAQRLYVALRAAIYFQRWDGEPLAAKPFEDELRKLQARYSEEALIAGTSRIELCSLANAAAGTRAVDQAMQLLDLAIQRFPDEEEPRRLRAGVRLVCGDFSGGLSDIALALDYNARRIAALEAQRDAWHPHDRMSRGEDQARIDGLKERRSQELALQVQLNELLSAQAAAKRAQ